MSTSSPPSLVPSRMPPTPFPGHPGAPGPHTSFPPFTPGGGTSSGGNLASGVHFKKHHKPLFRVGTTIPGSAVVVTEDPAQAIAALQALIQHAQQAAAAASDTPPMPVSGTITVTHVPDTN